MSDEDTEARLDDLRHRLDTIGGQLTGIRIGLADAKSSAQGGGLPARIVEVLGIFAEQQVQLVQLVREVIAHTTVLTQQVADLREHAADEDPGGEGE